MAVMTTHLETIVGRSWISKASQRPLTSLSWRALSSSLEVPRAVPVEVKTDWGRARGKIGHNHNGPPSVWLPPQHPSCSFHFALALP